MYLSQVFSKVSNDDQPDWIRLFEVVEQISMDCF